MSGTMSTLSLSTLFVLTAFLRHASAQWVTHGATMFNRRWAEEESLISPSTVANLTLRWNFPTDGDVTATPAIYRGVVYFPDWKGQLYALRQSNGSLIWKKSFSADYGFAAGVFSRATPAIAPRMQFLQLPEDILVIGTSIPAVVIAVSLKTGDLVWKTVVDTSAPAAKITGAATVFQGAVYVGVASDEEGAAVDPNYKCCTFQGNMAKLSLLTGAIEWKAYTLPLGQGYSGGAIWSATPAIDPVRDTVYAAVGNMYTLPPAVQKCIEDNPTRPSPDPCIVPENKQDSVIALNTSDGAFQWTTPLGPIDAWNLACKVNPVPNCPAIPGPDYDFGMNPMLITIADPRPENAGEMVEVAVTGQKSGIIFAVDRATGEAIWTTQAGPGGALGGMNWGMATDGLRIYAGNMNTDKTPFFLSTLNITITTGAWLALNASTGEPIWYRPNAVGPPAWSMLPSVANGVVFAGSADTTGQVYALDAESGEILWQFTAGTSVYGGVSISRGCIYFGHGYGSFTGPFGTSGGGPQNLYSFCV